MVSKNNELAAKRARAADLEKRVGRKWSRTKATTGAVVAGTEFDPRKGAAVKTMRTRDVEAHIRKLENALSRKTQFVAGAKGPLPRAAFNTYAKGAQAVRDKFANDLTPLANERLPGPGTETIGQRQAKIRGKHPTAMNMGYVPPVLEPFNIKNAESLIKLTKSNKKRMTRKWAKDEHKRAQEEMGRMVGIFNDPGLITDVQGLTYGQFDMIWNLTRFADAMSLGYHHIKAKLDSKEEVPESVLQDQIAEAKSIIEWVKKFNFEDPQWKNDPAQYGQDPFITKMKRQEMDATMEKKGYRRVGKQYYPFK
jgi:hypothetical protein